MPIVSNEQLLGAAKGGDLSVLKEWTKQNQRGDVNEVKDAYGSTPLHWACNNGHLECVKYLVEKCKADVSCINYGYHTPLHCACSTSKVETAEYLIESTSASIDIKNSDNKTPIDVIKANHQIKMMRSIINSLVHCNSELQMQLQMHKQNHTNIITTPSNHTISQVCTTTNMSIGQDRRTAVLTEAKADIIFLCGEGEEQQPIKANSGVLMVTVPSIQTLLDSGIQRQHADDDADDGAASIQATVPLPKFQPKHVRHVLQCIYTGEISFDDNANGNAHDNTHDNTHGNTHDTTDPDSMDQSPLSFNGQDDLQQLILVANEFSFWRLKLVLEAELARKHLTQDTMVHALIFADQHNCALLKDVATRMAAQNMQTLLARRDFGKLFQHPQLMGGIHVLCSEGMVTDGGDDEYGGMSMMELYKVVDEDEGAVQVDSYMDRVALLRFVRSITSSRVAESDGTAEEEN